MCKLTNLDRTYYPEVPYVTLKEFCCNLMILSYGKLLDLKTNFYWKPVTFGKT